MNCGNKHNFLETLKIQWYFRFRKQKTKQKWNLKCLIGNPILRYLSKTYSLNDKSLIHQIRLIDNENNIILTNSKDSVDVT